MKKSILTLVLTLISVAIINVLPALALQAAPPGLPSSPSQVPITGGLIFLAIGGGAYALKKLRGKP